jgi:hypothetical protein
MVFNIFSLTIEIRMDQKKGNNQKESYEVEVEAFSNIAEMKEQNFLRHSQEFMSL